MSKRMNLMLPAALCMIGALGLTACKDADVTTTAQASEPAADATSQGQAAPAREGSPGRERQVSAREATAEPTDRAAVLADREQRAAAAREARAARAAAAREGDVVSAREARAGIDAAARTPARRELAVTAEPGVLDFGEMATGDRRTGAVTLTNTSDTVVRLANCRSSCGCTVANCPSNHDLAPGESVEVDITLSGGSVAQRLSKTVNFVFEDHPMVTVTVSGDVIAYITLDPRVIDSESNPDGRIVVRSHDDQPFLVTGVAPQIVANLPQEPATEHELFVSWDQWRELRQPRRLEVSVDHPKTQSITAAIRNPARVAVADERRGRDASQLRPSGRVDLHESAQRGDAETILARIDEGADVDSTDARGLSLLAVAARHGQVDLMKALIEAGADVNFTGTNDGTTPLMNAAQSKNAEAVRLLLDAGADVNARDFTLGNSALSWAALSGDAETVQALLDAGAVVEVVARITGYTPLTWAAGFGEVGSVKLLLEAGADSEVACQVQGATPIMYAASTGRADNVKALVARGVNLEAKDNRGRTVLVFAAGQSGADGSVIQALIDAGADVHAVDRTGMNALDHARTRGDIRKDEVIAVLEPHFEE